MNSLETLVNLIKSAVRQCNEAEEEFPELTKEISQAGLFLMRAGNALHKPGPDKDYLESIADRYEEEIKKIGEPVEGEVEYDKSSN